MVPMESTSSRSRAPSRPWGRERTSSRETTCAHPSAVVEDAPRYVANTATIARLESQIQGESEGESERGGCDGESG